MGTPIQEIVIGNNCNKWDPPGETPKYLWCMFYGIKKGDDPAARVAPNGQVFRLTQDPAGACHWEFENLSMGWYIHLGIDAAVTWIALRDPGPPVKYYFEDTKAVSPIDEMELFTNEHDTEFFDWGWDGNCVVFWQSPFDTIPALLGFDQIPDLMLEVFSDSSHDLYFKYCSRSMHINVTLKIPR